MYFTYRFYFVISKCAKFVTNVAHRNIFDVAEDLHSISVTGNKWQLFLMRVF
jgi:hypothetical protein